MRLVNYQWPAQDRALIAPVQSLSGPGDLILNFNPFFYSGISRSVSVTSATGGENFTVYGFYKGKPVSKSDQTIANTPVDTSDGQFVNNTYPNLSVDDVIFDSVTRISVDRATANISAGSGLYGHTAWFNADYFTIAINALSLQVIVKSGNINYTWASTLQDVGTVPDSSLFLIDSTGGQLTDKNNSQFSGSQFPFVYGAIFITNGGGAATNDTGSLDAILLQQGSPRG